jgi:hypothetical protein
MLWIFREQTERNRFRLSPDGIPELSPPPFLPRYIFSIKNPNLSFPTFAKARTLHNFHTHRTHTLRMTKDKMHITEIFLMSQRACKASEIGMQIQYSKKLRIHCSM